MARGQTAGNACASVALLNIVNNIEGVELGENLQQFKNFTMSFTPALRGDAINNFEYIKRIHNSFARYETPHPSYHGSLSLCPNMSSGKWICLIQTYN